MGLEASDYNLLVIVCMLEKGGYIILWVLLEMFWFLEVDGYFYAPLCMSTVCLCTMACKVGDPSEVVGLDSLYSRKCVL